jgi:hypothetical protein
MGRYGKSNPLTVGMMILAVAHIACTETEESSGAGKSVVEE